ncbi:Deoxyhypusine hydroxylase [Rhodocollybia butyracea]|uniref:Deoxyhypusine hydroxylase n=1 Tax=Rhodocollybia butyracea TaxID=206335 RepID=A0A9P5PK95_9AGAR|nr:Deoxyhypusine hydroxylase [Rhodocollybia butyracea]
MSPSISAAQLQTLEDSLLNTSGNVPLHERFRSLFTLKSLKNEDAIKIISKGFQDSSALLKHELAYCLGQMKSASALPVLESVLRNPTEDPMVRHEAAEAMGAISASDSIPILKEYLSDSDRSVRETCEIAIARIEWERTEEGLLAGATRPGDVSQANIDELRSQLLDSKRALFERYRAMFALRNIGSPAAVDALAAGFSDDSALFKHEIAFVFGQLLSPHSVPCLVEVLQNDSESDMVRHEAAEALVLPHLKEWVARNDAPVVVRESCQIALDMWEYENSGDFQYANGLENTAAVAPIAVA